MQQQPIINIQPQNSIDNGNGNGIDNENNDHIIANIMGNVVLNKQGNDYKCEVTFDKEISENIQSKIKDIIFNTVLKLDKSVTKDNIFILFKSK